MPFQTGLADALRRRGLTVEVVPGWETRGSSSFNPRGSIAHWTAGPRGSKTRPSLNICVNGRAGLPGPLCNVYGARDGVAVVVAAGRANHGGAGTWKGLSGNSAFFGTEMEGADAADFTPAQRWAYPRIHAAYHDLMGTGADHCCSHAEYATPKGRKIDINGYPMSTLRAEIADLLANPQEDDMPAPHELWTFVKKNGEPHPYDRLSGVDWKTGQILGELAAMRATVDTLAKALAAQDNSLDETRLRALLDEALEEAVVQVTVDVQGQQPASA